MKKSFMKKVLLVGFCIAMILSVTGCSSLRKENPTDLKSFYGLVSGDEYVILLEGENVGTAYKDGDNIYLPYELVNQSINDKFYLDSDFNRILYTTPDEIEMFDVGGDTNTKLLNNQVYVSLECLKSRTDMKSEVYTDPNRIAITENFGEVSVCKPKSDTVIRQFDKDGADYMAKVSKGESLVIKDIMNDSWYRVVKDNGITGYIRINETNGAETEQRVSSYQGKEYSHITLDKTVCMGWHQVSGTAGNDSLTEVTKNGKGTLNVISPTWFKLADTSGEITSYAQASYVKKAHDMGMKVWALADDFTAGEDGTYYVGTVLAGYESRQKLIKNLVNAVKDCGADGLNIDYEKIYEDMANDYIEFIRELSIECRKNNIVLSVDTYVSQTYNQFYNRKGISEVADYLVIMGYDEHWAGDSEAGSVASLPYVQKGINEVLEYAPADRVINGIPFYTRLWTETKEGAGSEGTYVEDAVNGNYWLSSTAVGMEKAQTELSSHGITPTWLEDLSQYYGEYETNTGSVRIWLEEEKSIQAKLDFMKNAGIGGVACWKLGLEKASVWTEIADYVATAKQ